MSWRNLVECFNAFMKSVLRLRKTRRNVILKSVLVAFRSYYYFFFRMGLTFVWFSFFAENLNIYCASLSSEKALWRIFTLIFYFINILFYDYTNYTDKISYIYFWSNDKLIICKYNVYVQKM